MARILSISEKFFRYAPSEFVYQISGLYRYRFGQGVRRACTFIRAKIS